MGFVQARQEGAGHTALRSGDLPLSPGIPSSRSEQAGLDKIRKKGQEAGLVLVGGGSFCSSPSQGIGLETATAAARGVFAKALTVLWGSAAAQSPAEPELTWGWKTRHPHYCHLLGMQI